MLTALCNLHINCMQSDKQDVQTSSVMQLLNTIQGTYLKNLIVRNFFSLHLMTSLWHLLQHLSASLLKLTPQNNSMLPFKESDWPYKLFFLSLITTLFSSPHIFVYAFFNNSITITPVSIQTWLKTWLIGENWEPS